MKDEEVVVKKEKRTRFGKLFHLAVVVATIYGVVKAIAAFVRRLTRKVEEDNPWCDKKRYLAIGNEKNLNLSGEKVAGAEVYGVGAAVQVDLSEAELSSVTELSVRVLMSGVILTVPPMVRVQVESKQMASGVVNLVPTYENKELPLIYVTVNSLMSAVRVKVREE